MTSLKSHSNGKTINNFSSIEWLTTQAVAKHKEGKLEEAIAFYLEVIELDNNQPAWVYGNAITLMAQVDRLDEGLELGEKALNLHPESDEIYRAIGTIHQKKNNSNTGIKNITKQIEWLTTEAVTKHKEGKIDEAIAFYLEVIELDRNQPAWVYSNAITLMTQVNRINEGLNLGEKALKIYPESDEIYRAIGVVYEKQKDVSNCIEYYQKAITLETMQPDWLYCNLAKQLLNNEQITEAVKISNQGTQYYPNFYPLYYTLGQALMAESKWDQAISAYRRVQELNPSWLEIEEKLNLAIYQKNQSERYSNNYIETLSSIEWLTTQAVAKHKEGKIEEAIAFYLEVIELDDNQPTWVYGNAIILLSEVGGFEKGLKLAEKAENVHPESDEINRAIGVFLEKENSIDSIIRYRRAVKLNPNQPDWLYSNLARLLIENREFKKLVATCEQGIKIHENYYPLYYILGEAFAKQKNWDRAIYYFQNVKKLNPNYQQIEDRLNFTFYKKNQQINYRPKISAIVPNYNHGKYLRERLDSILNQTYDNFELLLLDDCSSDDSRTIIEEYQKRHPAKIKVFLNQENSGSVFKQWGKGLSHAEGNLIWICESDDSCEPDFLETLVGYFADPSVMIAFGRIQFIDENSVEFEGLDEYREKAAPGIWEQIQRFAAR